MQPALAGADLVVGNLECSITDGGAPEPKAYRFRAPPAAAEALGLAGLDVVSLANNHALDYGPQALAGTLQLLAAQGIAAAGAGLDEAQARAPVVIERNGVKVAFLAYVDVPVESRTGFDTRAWTAAQDAPGVAWAEAGAIRGDVQAARAQADVVVVLLHFGLEGRTQVTAAQRSLARAAVDAGAALVIGSHPHVLQAWEEYGGGLIAYSLGNFVFDGFSLPENYSAILAVRLTPWGVEAFEWIPIFVEDGLPRLATSEEAPDVLALLQP